MAVVDVKPNWSKGEAPISTEGRTAKRVYTVLLDGTDDPDDTLIVARQASGIPRVRQPYSTLDPQLRCVSVNPRALSPTLVEVTCNYATGDKSIDPLDEPPKRSWGSIVSEQPIDHDINGKPLVNTAGEPFDPPITIPVYDDVLRIVRNEATYDNFRMRRYRNSLNMYPFMGWPALTCKMVEISAEEIVEADWTYYQVTYEIHMRADEDENGNLVAWKRRVLNRGFRRFLRPEEEGYPGFIAIKDAEGEPVSEPVLLNLEGNDVVDKDNAVWLLFDVVKVADWRSLHLE